MSKDKNPGLAKNLTRIVFIEMGNTPSTCKTRRLEEHHKIREIANQKFRTPSKAIRPDPSLPTITRDPWRRPFPWDSQTENDIISDIKKLDPAVKPAILLVGPVGSGKSAFINAALSISVGYKVILALTGKGRQDQSFTKNYEEFSENTLLEKFSFRDCMGIEPAENEGFHVEDMLMLLQGHVKDNYAFNPRLRIQPGSEFYHENPKFCDKIHCVVFVIDAVVIKAIPEQTLQKIARLQAEINNLHIPRVVILTKVDRLCDEVRNDVTKMFLSGRVQDVVRYASEIFGIDEGSIHPVKNYETDIVLDRNTNIPILLALRQMMQYSFHYVLRRGNRDKD